MAGCVVVVMVVAMMTMVIVVVVVGGGIVMRLPGWVLVGVCVFDVIVAMGVRVAQSRHALGVSRGRRIASRLGRDWLAARRVLMPAPWSARL